MKLKQGSQEAFKSLYDLYAKRLYAFCMEYTHSRENTEEIVQDAFVWLWHHRGEIRQEHTIKNLLFLRVKHFLINALGPDPLRGTAMRAKCPTITRN